MEIMIERSLTKLIEILINHSSIFILGAGASSPEIPTTAELKKRVLRQLEGKIYSIPGGLGEFDDIRKKFLFSSDTWKSENFLLKIGITRETLLFAIHQEISDATKLNMEPSQYNIFKKVPTSAKILTFNSDGFAPKYCLQSVFEIHGRIIPGYLKDLDELDIIDETQIYNIPWHPETLWYPESETDASEKAGFGLGPYKNLLTIADSIAIIGYSFGLNSDGWDDAYSFKVLCESLRDRDTTIVIVDPFGEELSCRIEDSLRNRSVFYLPFRWNLLSKAILKASSDCSLISIINIAQFVKEILSEYSTLERKSVD